jgi:hypothetical protein
LLFWWAYAFFYLTTSLSSAGISSDRNTLDCWWRQQQQIRRPNIHNR